MISLVCIAKNEEHNIAKFLKYYQWVDDIVVVDNESNDNTAKIARQFTVKVFVKGEYNLGKLKRFALSQTEADWILFLDIDELISQKLKKEIKRVIKEAPADIHGYWIPYQNYVFGKPVYYGGERYRKVRLFRRKFGTVTPASIHEEFRVSGKLDQLSGVIHHYSYRTPRQLFIKFTRYGWLAAEEKLALHEKITFNKLFLYAGHMFLERFIMDQGWRDGWRGLILASMFGYMEGLTYWLLAVRYLFYL